MAVVRQRHRILQTANQRSNLAFGTNGQFEVLTRYNGLTDSFTISIFQGSTAVLNEQPILPGMILNLFAPRCTFAIGGNLWINSTTIPSADDIGKSVELIYEFEN